MKFTRTEMTNVIIFGPYIICDGRVYFKETYSKDKLIEFYVLKLNIGWAMTLSLHMVSYAVCFIN